MSPKFRPMLRETRCPTCRRRATAELIHPDNGMWTLRPHTTDLVSGAWCPASDGRWRLRTDKGGPGSAVWQDGWERSQ